MMHARRTRRIGLPLVFAAPLLVAACGGHPETVSPADVPALQQRVQREPQNGPLVLRYAAALYAANRFDTAARIARTGMALAPADALGPLVLGRCLEHADSLGAAIAVYDAFLAAHPDAKGHAAVAAQRLIAYRTQATARARYAVQHESTLAATPPDPQTVAVLPLTIAGDSAYQPLSRGLAQILTSDLALLRRFRMVERLELHALLDEMHLGQTGRVDPQTVAHVGHLVEAGRMVQGLANIANQANTRLEASVVLSSGEVTTPAVATGRFRDLLKMEKDVVVGIASRLGYTLSEAERKAILENGTQDLTAFLAYSRGLVAEDAGDYSAASLYFGQAVQADPKFSAAKTSYQASKTVPAVQQASAGQVTTVAQEQVPAPEPPAETTALDNVTREVAPLMVEQLAPSTPPAQEVVTTPATNPPPPSTTPSQTVTGTILIIFRLP